MSIVIFRKIFAVCFQEFSEGILATFGGSDSSYSAGDQLLLIACPALKNGRSGLDNLISHIVYNPTF